MAGITRAPGLPKRTLTTAIALVIAASLAFASPATAQNDPSNAQYCEEGVLNEVTGECQEGTGTFPSQSSGDDARGLNNRVVGSLPFTGLDLVALGAVALALLGTGFALRRLSAPRDL